MLCDESLDCFEAVPEAQHERPGCDGGDEDDRPASAASQGSSFQAISPAASWQDLEELGKAAAACDTRELLVRFFSPSSGSAGRRSDDLAAGDVSPTPPGAWDMLARGSAAYSSPAASVTGSDGDLKGLRLLSQPREPTAESKAPLLHPQQQQSTSKQQPMQQPVTVRIVIMPTAVDAAASCVKLVLSDAGSSESSFAASAAAMPPAAPMEVDVHGLSCVSKHCDQVAAHSAATAAKACSQVSFEGMLGCVTSALCCPVLGFEMTAAYKHADSGSV